MRYKAEDRERERKIVTLYAIATFIWYTVNR